MENQVKFDLEQASHLSQKYAYISSDDVVELAAKADLKPIKVWTKNKGYQRIDFIQNQSRIVGDSIARLSFINSFDGSRCAEIMFGLVRLVCSNGATAPIFGDEFYFRHVGFNPERCLDAFKKAIKVMPEIFTQVEALKSKELTPAQQVAFAHKAIQLRFDNPERVFNSTEINSVLTPRREADLGNDAWKIFNVVQENLVRGMRGSFNVRAIKSGKTDNDFNKGLWTLALAA